MLVNFEGTPRGKNIPNPIENETFKQWKDRVLGNTVSNVVVYAPIPVAANKRVHTLQNQSSTEHIENIFHAYGKAKDQQKIAAIEETTTEITRKHVSFPKETLEIILDENQDNQEPSVREFFDRFLNSSSPDIDTEEMLRALIRTYNEAVRQYRERG